MVDEYKTEQVASLAAFLHRAETPEWHADAACADYPKEVFFGHEERAGLKRHRPNLTSTEVREAKAICEQCPVRLECLGHALRFNERYGIWGGTTPNERYGIWGGTTPTER